MNKHFIAGVLFAILLPPIIRSAQAFTTGMEIAVKQAREEHQLEKKFQMS